MGIITMRRKKNVTMTTLVMSFAMTAFKLESGFQMTVENPKPK